ncbi:MAG: DsbA family protein [Solirubrobacteraceae bacterium]
MGDPFENDLPHTQPPEQAFGQPEETLALKAGTRRRHRLIQLAVVAVLAAAAIFAIATSAGTPAGSPPRSRGAEIEQRINRLLTGIPQSSNKLGRASAPVRLLWFGDLECPFCREFALGALPSLIQRWVRSGRLQIEYLSFKTATRESKVFQAQEVAALAAGMQNRMWNFLETFLHEQGGEDTGYVTDRFLDGIVRQIPGLNETLWSEDRHNPTLAARVASGLRFAGRAGFRGTPAFLIGRRGGALARLTPGSLTSPQGFSAAIESLLNAGKAPKPQYVLDSHVPLVPQAISD